MLQDKSKGSLDHVGRSRNSNSQNRRSQPRQSKAPVAKSQTSPPKCTRCGNKPHQRRDQCPAREVECHHCKKKGHFSSQCRTKDVHDLASQPPEEEEDLSYLTAVGCEKESSWSINTTVNSKQIKFKVDTGAEVTALTESALTQLGKLSLHPATKIVWA